jgi:hypothetical protein
MFIRVAFLACILMFQEQDGVPPEAPADRPACDNYRNTIHKCACAKAKKCGGHIDEPPDPAIMSGWCSQYCRKDKCKCIGPCETHLKHIGGHRG